MSLVSHAKCRLLLLAAILAVAPAAAMAAPDPFDAFFDTFREKRAAIETVQARFTQINIYPGSSDEGRGVVRFRAPNTLLLRYDDREGEAEVVYHIDGSAVREYDAFVEQLLVLPIEQAPDAQAFMLSFANDPTRLRELYDITLTETVTGDGQGEKQAQTPGIRLEPKAVGDAGKPFEWAHLELREEDYLPVRIHIQRDLETQVMIRVEDYAVNEPLGEEGTSIFLPEGTAIIEDDQVVERVGEAGKQVPIPNL